MTLEQLVNRQKSINHSLKDFVNQNTSLISKIAGVYDTPMMEENNVEKYVEESLLKELEEAQQQTEYLINDIYRNHSRLYEATYTPTQNVM